MTDLHDVERLIAALRPWLGQVVIVGGWAHRLHHAHPLAKPPGYAPVRTRDADVAFGARARLTGRIADALRVAGFVETLSSDETPPVAHYQLGTDDQGFYTEFLTPLTGSGVRRDGTADTTVARAGIIAQKLRHLEVLLVAPWRCPVGGGEGSVLDTAVEVAVANPVSFVAQRLLIHASRAPAKRAQDILYLHDTVQLFGASLEPFNAIWRTDVSPSLSRTRRALKLEAEVELEHGLGWHGIRARWATERTHGDLKAAAAAAGWHDMGTYLGYGHRDQAEHRAVVALPRVQVARFMVTPEEPTVRRARRAGTPRVARQRFSTRYPMVTQHRWAHPAPLVPTRPPSSACIGTRREQSGPNKTPAAT